MSKKEQSVMTSLGRISRYLPNTDLDRLSRIRVDGKGRIWVDEDTILIILRGHLIIERELVDICDRCLRQPEALSDRLSFDTRLCCVRALLGDEEFPKVVYDILIELNKIRNKLVHNLDPKDLNKDLQGFVRRFSAFPDLKGLLKDKDIPECLLSCITVLCGMLGSIRPGASPAPPDA